MERERRPPHAALLLLAGALVVGVLTLHALPVGVLGAHSPLPATRTAHGAVAASTQAGDAGTTPPETAETATEQVCHPDGAGHGAPSSAHAVACDLSVPPVSAAAALGAAGLVAVVAMALLSPSAGPVAGGGWHQRRGPPRGRLLRLSLCVVRV